MAERHFHLFGKLCARPENATDYATQRVIYFQNAHKFKLLGHYSDIRAHWPTWRGWHFRLAGKRYTWTGGVFPISESVAYFAPRRIIVQFSANLSLCGGTPEFGRIGRQGRDTFPSGRGALRISGKRFPDFGEHERLCDPNGYLPNFHKFELLGHYPRIRAHWPTWQEYISISPWGFTRGRETFFRPRATFPDFGKRDRLCDPNGYFPNSHKFKHPGHYP